MRPHGRSTLVVMAVVASMALPTAAAAQEPPGPLFGLGTNEVGEVLVANAAVGVVTAAGEVVARLPGVTDVAASDQGWLWAITGLSEDPADTTDQKLYKIENGAVTEFADLGAYEAKYNPHPAEIDSNPFSVIDLGGGEAVVADAGGNTLLKVDRHGKVKLIAVLPNELVPTDNAKAIIEEAFGFSCESLPPGVPPDAEEICALPSQIPAEPVATSVTIGPDGDFYVGELKGFPAPLDESRIWRIASNARNADCSISPLCSVAYDGFTSIVDLSFDGDTLYVAEMSEKSWLAVELVLFAGLPIDPGVGTIDACTDACHAIASIPLLSGITVDGDGDLWHTSLFGPTAELP